jgi:hypothetical protein
MFLTRSVMLSPECLRECSGTAQAVQFNCILVSEQRYLKVFSEWLKLQQDRLEYSDVIWLMAGPRSRAV